MSSLMYLPMPSSVVPSKLMKKNANIFVYPVSIRHTRQWRLRKSLEIVYKRGLSLIKRIKIKILERINSDNLSDRLAFSLLDDKIQKNTGKLCSRYDKKNKKKYSALVSWLWYHS